jgi:putative membrane protein
MESIFSQFLNTMIMRPYVFAFFLIYFLGCSLHLGVKRALLFSIAGYIIAWLSEYSSIHNGIPYGYYYYIEHTRSNEIWVFGVPLMDSMSYVFLAYASYSMALTLISPLLISKASIYLLETKKIRNSFSARILGTIFFVYLDVIIDPVALRGDRWFLGQIYGYREQGVYFGVPISNFIGWFVVGFILIYVLQKIDNFLYDKKIRDYLSYKYPWRHLIGPALYVCILVFNLTVTFFIGELNLGWVGIFIVLLPSVMFFFMLKIKLSGLDIQNALIHHKQDFPHSVAPVEK